MDCLLAEEENSNVSKKQKHHHNARKKCRIRIRPARHGQPDPNKPIWRNKWDFAQAGSKTQVVYTRPQSHMRQEEASKPVNNKKRLR